MRRSPPVAALALCAFAVQATSGCLSHEYEIPSSELQRVVQLAPEARGAKVRLVQQMGNRRDSAPPVQAQPYAPPPVQPEAHAPPPSEVAEFGWGLEAVVDSRLGGGGGRGPASSRPASANEVASSWRGTSGAAPRAPEPAPGAIPARTAPRPSGGGGGPALPVPSSGKSEDLIAVAVIIVAVAVMAAAGLAMTEGMRYDGFAALSPHHPVHLKYERGVERVVELGALGPLDVVGLQEALVKDDEGYGIGLLGRAPLDRRGFAFRLDVGGIQSAFEDYSLAGFASNIQIGYFFHQRAGLLANLSLTGGHDVDRRAFARHALGLEGQVYPLRLGRLHAGLFGGFGRAVAAAGVGSEPGTSLGGGLSLELELVTRLALTARAGWQSTRLDAGGWGAGAAVTMGIAVY